MAKKKKNEPAHWVKFEDADTPDRMMDTEIVRYLAPDTESAHAATFTRSVSEKQADELGYWDDARAEEMATLWEKGCFRRVKADQVDRKDICEGRFVDATKESGGEILKFKSRWTAKGYSMIQG